MIRAAGHFITAALEGEVLRLIFLLEVLYLQDKKEQAGREAHPTQMQSLPEGKDQNAVMLKG